MAIKQFSAKAAHQDILHEVEILHMFRSDTHSHPNLVRALGAFRGEYMGLELLNLAYPLAETSLQALLSGSDVPKIVNEALPSLRYQFEGLAGGLDSLHRQRRLAHGDIKPSKILLFVSEVHNSRVICAKITDFGSSLELNDTRTGTANSEQHRLSQTSYLNEVRRPDDRTSAEIAVYDVWSMGKVFLETFAFLLGGVAGRDVLYRSSVFVAFDDTRTSRKEESVQARDKVFKWIHVAMKKDYRSRALGQNIRKMLAEPDNVPTANRVWVEFLEVRPDPHHGIADMTVPAGIAG